MEEENEEQWTVSVGLGLPALRWFAFCDNICLICCEEDIQVSFTFVSSLVIVQGAQAKDSLPVAQYCEFWFFTCKGYYLPEERLWGKWSISVKVLHNECFHWYGGQCLLTPASEEKEKTQNVAPLAQLANFHGVNAPGSAGLSCQCVAALNMLLERQQVPLLSFSFLHEGHPRRA